MLLLSASVLAGEFEAGVDAAASGDYEAALHNWRPLADAGHVDAQFNIGLLYDNGAGVERDPAEAARWYRLAAEAGDATAQAYLAEMYARGQGVEQDLSEAVEWYRKAALQRDGTAAYNLGILYASGRGVPLDDVYAYAWLSVAEASGQSSNGVLELMASGMSPARKEQAEALRKELFARCGLH
ncbi:MAG: tetratricopeptide repeat protein [Gammaproteobacteria bacterium]|nr:tetratricopeptide repeat protein [Gammaproteobacteria bacterium]